MPRQRLMIGDCLERMRQLPATTFTAVVTDPPYGLKFMGREWDHGVPGVPFWAEALRICKPGAILLAFGGTRTYHRLTCAIEDAGWEIRDCLMWLYGSGFPKNHDISKAIDKAAGAKREVVGQYGQGFRAVGSGLEGWQCSAHSVDKGITAPATDAAKQWDGWGTALKPAFEPVVLAMKPLDGTFAHNALTHGVAGLNIDGGRVGLKGKKRPSGSGDRRHGNIYSQDSWTQEQMANGGNTTPTQGRWPANLILSHVPPDENGEGGCRCVGVRKVGSNGHYPKARTPNAIYGGGKGTDTPKGEERFTASPDGTETVKAWECVESCPVRLLDEQSGVSTSQGISKHTGHSTYQWSKSHPKGTIEPQYGKEIGFGDTGGASRFFYHAKASRTEREAGLLGHLPCLKCGGIDSKEHTIDGKKGKCVRNGHPTVKPLGLMRYLVKLITQPEGTKVLDPFCGSGSTIIACKELGVEAVGIDNDSESVLVAATRVSHAKKG